MTGQYKGTLGCLLLAQWALPVPQHHFAYSHTAAAQIMPTALLAPGQVRSSEAHACPQHIQVQAHAQL